MCKERTIIIDIVIPTGMESTQGSGPQPEPTYHLNLCSGTLLADNTIRKMERESHRTGTSRNHRPLATWEIFLLKQVLGGA